MSEILLCSPQTAALIGVWVLFFAALCGLAWAWFKVGVGRRDLLAAPFISGGSATPDEAEDRERAASYAVAIGASAGLTGSVIIAALAPLLRTSPNEILKMNDDELVSEIKRRLREARNGASVNSDKIL